MTIHRRPVFTLFVCLLVLLFINLPVHAGSEPTNSGASNDGVIVSTAGENNDAPTTEPVEEVVVSPAAEDDKTNKISKDKKSADQEPIAAPESATTSSMSASAFTSSEKSDEVALAPLFLENATFTGAATYAIPIEVPPGRNNVQPDIKLLYNSYQKNGWLGLGWSLDMGCIKRSTRFGLNYSAEDFQYEINGAANHLAAMPDWGSNYYSQEIEGEFTKFFYNTATGGWEAYQKSGLIAYFGSTPASRIETAHGTFQWYLDRIEDTNGNFMTVTYTTDQGQIYLNEINYTGNGSLQPDKHVLFYLQDRPDTVLPHQAHAQIKTTKRLKTIAVLANDLLVRAYEIKYDENGAPFTAHSQIIEVKEHGSNASVDTDGKIAGGTSLPSTVFEWKNNPAFSFTQTSNAITTSEIDDGTGLYYGDLNGDGKTDVMWWKRSSGSNYWYLNEGNGKFSSPIINPIDKNHLDNHGNLYFGDWDGDGKTDVMWWYIENGRNRWFINDGNLNFTAIINPINTNYIDNNGNLYFGDWNGDGKTDVMWFYKNEGRNRWFINDGNCSFNAIINPIPPGTVDGNDRSVYFGDWNGDGITDFLWRNKETGANKWYTNDGTCQFLLTQDPVPRDLIDNFGSLHFGDWNGDGISDFMRFKADTGRNRWFINDGNLGFSDLIDDPVPPDQIDNSAGKLLLGDWNGDGITDFMWYNKDSGGNRWYTNDGTCKFELVSTPVPANQIDGGEGISFGDWNGDGITDFNWYKEGSGKNDWYVNGQTHSFLITSITSPQKAKYGFEYLPSSHYENVLLPATMQTLSKVSVESGLDDPSVSGIHYSKGLFDYATREFRGFEIVTLTNPDLTVVRKQYHQGRFNKGRTREEKFYAEGADPDSDSPLILTTNTWETEYLDAPNNTIAFVKLSQTRTEQYDADTVFTQQDFTYDSTHGNPVSMTSSGTGAESLTTEFEWQSYGEWLWRKTKETLTGATSGKVREGIYAHEFGTGNLQVDEKWLSTGTNPQTSFQYDSYGNVTLQTDPRGNATAFEYDADTATYPVKITNAAGHVVEMAWDTRYGKKLWVKNPNGNSSYYAYDPFGRIMQTDLPDGGQTTVAYFDEAMPRYTTTSVKEDSTGSTIDSYRYVDGLGREVQTVALGENKHIVTKTLYDKMGRPELKAGPFFADFPVYIEELPSAYPYQRIEYDDRGRPIAVESPHAQWGTIETSITYNGFNVTIIDPDSSIKAEQRDYLGRITRVTEFNGAEQYHTNYAYNAAGDLVSVTDHLGNVTSVYWDSLGRKTAMDDPDMGAWSYTYDANGNMLTQTDAKNQTITFSYDTLNRVTYKSYNTPDPAVAYLYDDTTAGKNGIGRLKSIESSAAIIALKAYDGTGRVLEENKQIIGNATVYTTTHAYDLSGKRIRTVHPDGYTVENAFYPGTGLLQSVTGNATLITQNSQYQPNGKMGRVDFGNGTYTTYSYDALSEKLTGIVTSNGLGTQLQNRSYMYSQAGDIEEIDDVVNNVTYTYTYDDMHRLIGETNTGPAGPISYTYNAIGNMTSRTAGADSFTYGYGAAGPHAVSSMNLNGSDYTYTYDANGNMTASTDFTDPANPAPRTLTWNADNMPLSVTRSGVTTSFTYDGAGRRAKKQVGSANPTYYISNEYEVIGGADTKYIFAGNLRVAKVSATGVYYFHKDHLGSSTVMTTSSGGVVETSEYRPYGSNRSQSGTTVSDYKFTDQEFDPSSGLYNYDGRLYDPIIGRFISADPFVQNPFNPQILNRYTYCLNNPLIYVDPSGYFIKKLWKGAKKVGKAIGKAFKSVGNAINSFAQSDIGQGLIGAIQMVGAVLMTASLIAHPWDAPITFPVAMGMFASGAKAAYTFGDGYSKFAKATSGGSSSGGGGGRGAPDANGSMVYQCYRKADFAWNENIGLWHTWLKTPTMEAGLGPADGRIPGVGDQVDSPYVSDTMIVDHTGEYKRPGAVCVPLPGVPADCVNDMLQVGKPMGKWDVTNTCMTFVERVKIDCRNRCRK